jgi:hypothetical protein
MAAGRQQAAPDAYRQPPGRRQRGLCLERGELRAAAADLQRGELRAAAADLQQRLADNSAINPSLEDRWRYSADMLFVCDTEAWQCPMNCNEDGSDPTGDETLDSLHDMLAQPHVKPKSAEHKAIIRRYDTPRPLLRPPPQKE